MKEKTHTYTHTITILHPTHKPLLHAHIIEQFSEEKKDLSKLYDF
jgi:hypothetical protein